MILFNRKSEDEKLDALCVESIQRLYDAKVADGHWRAPRMRLGSPAAKLAKLRWEVKKEKQRANNCSECGECLEKCPQRIQIPDWIKKAHEKLFIPDFKPPFEE